MIKAYKPTSPGRRNQTALKIDYDQISKTERKKLTRNLKGPKGRSKGRISVHHQARGAKKHLRLIDFKRDNHNIEGTVNAIVYDPNRSANIALVYYSNGDKRFILATEKMKKGSKVISGPEVKIKDGNTTLLKKIPNGTPIHNIELYPGAGGKFVKSAGSQATITAKDGNKINVKMPSGEVRVFNADCYATIGRLSNFEWNLVNLGKAGRNRHKGVRPNTRGIAQTVNDHIMGGKYSRRIGKQPADKHGNLSKGKKTRKRKHTNRYIVKDRRL